MNLLDPQDWTFPVPIRYGPGRLREVAALAAAAGMSRPLVVTDRGGRNLPFIAATLAHLRDGGLAPGLFADISPNPRADEIAAGRAFFLDGVHDGVIAIGGGSGMDGGKAIALVAGNDIDLWAFDYDRPSPESPPPFPPLICIPTTAGTGAETESTAMVTDPHRRMKYCVWHPALKPAAALLDPALTLSLPPRLTAWTGLDAVTHAIEAYSVPAFHPLCDGAALEALRLTTASLPAAVADGGDLSARGAMLAGTCLAGVAFLKGLGLVHAISHAIGAEYDTHHGLTNAVLLPAVLRFNAPSLAGRLPPMAAAMNLPDPSFDGFHGAICALLDRLEIPRDLTEIGVPADCARPIAERAALDAAAATNPRAAGVEEIAGVIGEALTRGR